MRGAPDAEALRHILELLESRLDLAVRTVEEEIEVFGPSRTGSRTPGPDTWAGSPGACTPGANAG